MINLDAPVVKGPLEFDNDGLALDSRYSFEDLLEPIELIKASDKKQKSEPLNPNPNPSDPPGAGIEPVDAGKGADLEHSYLGKRPPPSEREPEDDDLIFTTVYDVRKKTEEDEKNEEDEDVPTIPFMVGTDTITIYRRFHRKGDELSAKPYFSHISNKVALAITYKLRDDQYRPKLLAVKVNKYNEYNLFLDLKVKEWRDLQQYAAILRMDLVTCEEVEADTSLVMMTGVWMHGSHLDALDAYVGHRGYTAEKEKADEDPENYYAAPKGVKPVYDLLHRRLYGPFEAFHNKTGTDVFRSELMLSDNTEAKGWPRSSSTASTGQKSSKKLPYQPVSYVEALEHRHTNWVDKVFVQPRLDLPPIDPDVMDQVPDSIVKSSSCIWNLADYNRECYHQDYLVESGYTGIAHMVSRGKNADVKYYTHKRFDEGIMDDDIQFQKQRLRLYCDPTIKKDNPATHRIEAHEIDELNADQSTTSPKENPATKIDKPAFDALFLVRYNPTHLRTGNTLRDGEEEHLDWQQIRNIKKSHGDTRRQQIIQFYNSAEQRNFDAQLKEFYSSRTKAFSLLNNADPSKTDHQPNKLTIKAATCTLHDILLPGKFPKYSGSVGRENRFHQSHVLFSTFKLPKWTVLSYDPMFSSGEREKTLYERITGVEPNLGEGRKGGSVLSSTGMCVRKLPIVW